MIGMIPVLEAPLPDELFYSWIHRLAEANCLPFCIFSDSYLGTVSAKMGSMPVDVRREVPHLYHHLNIYSNLSRFFLNHSTYSFEAIWMTQGEQARYINNVFRKRDLLNPPVNTFFPKIKLCPKCLREDRETKGRAYIHRSHQLSGVCTCHKHHNLLLEYHGKRGHECEFHLEDYEVPAVTMRLESLNAYATYAKALFDSGINTDVVQLKNALYKVLHEKGYRTTDNYGRFIEDINEWPYHDLISVDIEHFMRVKMISATYITAEELLPFLIFLFPSVSDLIEAIKVDKPLLIDCICPKCGTTYCTTDYIKRMNCGCPDCENKIPVQQRFCRYVKALSEDYSPQEELESLDKPILMYHNLCGQSSRIKPRAFLFEGVRCLCEYIVTERDARKAIESHDGFKLIKFDGANKTVKIYREVCGHTFECRYHKFINFPGCRICKPKHMNAEIFEERIQNLVGNEYTILNGFVNQKTKISLRHEICGQVQEYKPSAFLDGQRCRFCSRKNVLSNTWNSWYSLLCEYYHEFGNINITKRAVYKERNLGLWLQRQRDAKKRGSLSDREIQQLEALEIVWDPLEMEWQRRYAQYQRYVEQTGSTHISRRTDFEGEHLGTWVETQRKMERMGKLSKDRAAKLKDLNDIAPRIDSL